MIKEVKKDLFKVLDESLRIQEKPVYLLHCISQDLKMGAGIAVPIRGRFDCRNIIQDGKGISSNPNYNSGPVGYCIQASKNLSVRVMNLITKPHFYDKPTYDTLRKSLKDAREMILKDVASGLVLTPRIGCGLDKLEWSQVYEMLKKEFDHESLKIIVCYL